MLIRADWHTAGSHRRETLNLERVNELLTHSLPHQIHHQHNIVLPNAFLSDEVLHLEQVEAVLGDGLTHLLLLAFDMRV